MDLGKIPSFTCNYVQNPNLRCNQLHYWFSHLFLSWFPFLSTRPEPPRQHVQLENIVGGGVDWKLTLWCTFWNEHAFIWECFFCFGCNIVTRSCLDWVTCFFFPPQKEIRQAMQVKRKETRTNKINENRALDRVSALDRFQSKAKT